MTTTRGQSNLGSASPMTRVEWAIARYNWYRACGLLDDLPRQAMEVATYQRSPDPPPPKSHLKWYPLSKPDDDIAAKYQQSAAPTQRHLYSQQAANSHPQTVSTLDYAEKALNNDSRTWSRVDWAIARYNWYRACGLLDDLVPPTAETTRYQRSPDPPPPKSHLKWYPLSKSDDDTATTYQRSVTESPPELQRRCCQRVEHARARAMLARYQAENEKAAKGTGPGNQFDPTKHPRDDIGRFAENGEGGTTTVGETSAFRTKSEGNGSSSAPSRRKLRRTDTIETGTGHIWDVDGRPWELTRQQVKDWDAITSRGALSDGLSRVVPSFWTSIEDFEAEVRRQARSYRDQILRVEGSAADANPIDLARRHRDRAQTALQKEFVKAATTVDNVTFVAGLAKAPLKLGVKALTTTAEHQAAAAIASEARSLAALQARSSIDSSISVPASIAQADARKIATAIDNVIPVVEPTRPMLRLTYQPTSLTIQEVRALPQPRKWKAGEKYVQELSGSAGQRHFAVPKGSQIQGSGGRYIDAPVDFPNGTIIAAEVKTYGKWRTVNGVKQMKTVPLNKPIREQILKDVWLRNNVQGYDPRWIFLDAPPSSDLSQVSEAKPNYICYSWWIGLQMRQLTPDEREFLEGRLSGFDVFLEERMPVLAEFMGMLGLPDPALVLVHAEKYLPALDQWLQRQSISDEDRTWLLTRVGYYVGEYFVQTLNGHWLVNENPETRTFARYVVGRFSKISNSNAMLDPFEVTADLLAEPPGRSLIQILTEIEQAIVPS
jgi:hypothetical protein